jgi:DNA-binding winged helix-turn-helix (wHTH) protein/tetratricopeptide (TPR) repeat protein
MAARGAGRVIFRFGRFELDEDAGELRRDGATVEIQPKPLALLQLLLRERERVVPTDELFDALWPGIAVTPGSLTRAISHARRAIGDTHRGERIVSVARRGYRFSGEVRVLDARGAPGATASSPGAVREATPEADVAGAPFVGRTDALSRLGEAWSRAESSAAGVAFVTGAPGIGKTRLAEAFAAEAERSGALVVVARCRDGEGVPAFWPWAQLLRRLRADEEMRDLVDALAGESEEARALVPELAGAEGGPARSAAAPRREAHDTAPSRFVFFDAVTRMLAAASRRRPLLLVLEDAQWAGAPSLRLLERVAFEAEDERLLLVATIREGARERGHPVDRTLALLRPHPRCVHVELEAFTRAEVAALLERTLGAPAPPDLTSELYGRTEGVPLFVREAIRWLEQRGDLAGAGRAPGRGARSAGPSRRRGILLPDAALDLLRRGLDALSDEAARLASLASVLGRQFSLPLLASLADVSREAAALGLEEATRAGVVEPAPEDAASWRFAHALFEEVAYERIAPGERARLHHRVALLLERRHAADPDAVISELAHHHHRGLAVGDPERAFAAAVRAAERAAAVLAWEEAAVHYQQALGALDHAETADPARRLDTLLALGETLRLGGERGRRLEVFDEAIALARAQDKPLALARAAIGRCDLAEWSPRDEGARAAVKEAIAALGESRVAERARLVTRLAYLEVRRSREASEPLARRALALAEETGDAEALQETRYTLHFAIAGPDSLPERAELVAAMVDAAEGRAARAPALIGLVDLACDRIAVGDGAGARALRARAAAVAGDDPHPGMAWHLRVYDTGLALLEGRFEHARRLAAEAVALGRRVEHPFAAGCHRVHQAERAWEQGELEETQRWLGPLIAADTGPTHWLRAVDARIDLALGREAQARAALAVLAASDFDDVPRNIRWTRTLVELAHLAADLGDASVAARLVALLTPVEHHHGVLPVPICYGGPVARALARLLEVLGQGDDALALYESAHESAAALGARPARARTLVEWGTLLRRHGDRRRGAERIEEGLRLAEEMGLAGLRAR